jgi:acetolactate synthase regulatory subunit
VEPACNDKIHYPKTIASLKIENQEEDKTVERILKVTKKSGNRERDVGCCLYESANRKLVDYKINEFLKFL